MDPILLEVLWSRLINIVNEQAAALMRTAFSSIIRDAGDLSAGVFDPLGRMLAQADTGTPGHINAMATSMGHFLRAYPPSTLAEGDVLITNNPWQVSGQLHDLTIVTPAFHQGKLAGFFASTCHAVDIGGRGLGAEGRSIFEEGLHIPICKLIDRGEPNRTLLLLIGGNVREPDVVEGDIYAQVAGNQVGVRRLVECMDEFRLDSIIPLGDEILDRSEAAMRQAIARIPAGSYEGDAWTDGYDQPIYIKATVRVAADGISVDFTGTSPQSPYGINVVLNYAAAYCTYALKCLVSPDIPNNAGAFRPLRVTAPEGCILNARWPAPVAGRHVLGHFVPGAVFKALQGVIPSMADGAANIWTINTGGLRADGRPWATVAPTAGGTGARALADGLSATAFPSGLHGVPVEIMETTAPLVVYEKELRPDSGGAGRWRGGLGYRMVLGCRSGEPWQVSILCDRTRYPAEGFAGAGPGALAEVIYSTGPVASPKATMMLPPDATVTIGMPGGGGYGDPRERPRELVANDVRQGYVTAERARDAYGYELQWATYSKRDAVYLTVSGLSPGFRT